MTIERMTIERMTIERMTIEGRSAQKRSAQKHPPRRPAKLWRGSRRRSIDSSCCWCCLLFFVCCWFAWILSADTEFSTVMGDDGQRRRVFVDCNLFESTGTSAGTSQN
jgi:hypothetical protein